MSLSIPIKMCNDTNKTVDSLALIDSRAGGKFIDQNYVQKLGITSQKLDEPLTVRNVDGTPNKKEKLPLLLPSTLLSMEEQDEPGC